VRRERHAAVWQTAVYLTSLGWLLALPIAAGVLLGRYLDSRLESGHFWTQVLLGAGVAVACVEGYLVARMALRRRYRG
jgi:predicted F0F1-ATPase subunit